MPCIGLKQVVGPRRIYLSFRKTAGKMVDRGVDMNGMSLLITKAYRLMEKYVMLAEDLSEILIGFLMIYGTNDVLQFVRSNQKWVLGVLSVGAGILLL